MVANVIVGMLCVYLLCFSAMFWMIGTRLHGQKMGLDVFALGSLMLSVAYTLQLLEGRNGWSAMSWGNHCLTLAAPVVFCLGAMRFFGRQVPVGKLLLLFFAGYGALQWLVQMTMGTVARYALLSLGAGVLFLGMAAVAVHAMRSFAKDLRLEMLWFAVLIGCIGGLNLAKLWLIVTGGLEALDMNHTFQLVFYLYMSFLVTVIPPSVVWLLMRRLTEQLHEQAIRDPLTGLLNRRGLEEALTAYFSQRKAVPVHLLMMDVDHFKQINDRHGHQAGDMVLRTVVDVMRRSLRSGDLLCRLGGEEFVAVCLDTDMQGAGLLAERIRSMVAQHDVVIGAQGRIRCTLTLGVGACPVGMQWLDKALRLADEALYRGKSQGRNCVEFVNAGQSVVLTAEEGGSPAMAPQHHSEEKRQTASISS